MGEVSRAAVGKSWPATSYQVGREKIKEYTEAVGFENPVYFDLEAARDAGFRDVVAPPMFAVVYSLPAMTPALFDPEVAMNFAAMVHGGQEFEWGDPVCSGDLIETAVTCLEIEQRGDLAFYVFESISKNQEDAQVVRGVWTNIVRGI